MDIILYKRNIAYRVRTINNKSILFGENQCFELNELALIVWNSLAAKNTIDGLVDIILKEYDIDKNVALRDVIDFIDSMKKHNIILESE